MSGNFLIISLGAAAEIFRPGRTKNDMIKSRGRPFIFMRLISATSVLSSERQIPSVCWLIDAITLQVDQLIEHILREKLNNVHNNAIASNA